MAGRIIDLVGAGLRLPDAVLLDTSVVIPRFLPKLRTPGPNLVLSQARVRALLADIAAQGAIAFVASTTFAELAHLVLRLRYDEDRFVYPNPATGRPFPSWKQLYKQRPGLARSYAASIEALRLALAAADILVLQANDLGPIASGRRFEQELIRLVRRYRLDSADVAILLEARRAGITTVVSEDPDWRRVASDFDVYTWL